MTALEKIKFITGIFGAPFKYEMDDHFHDKEEIEKSLINYLKTIQFLTKSFGTLWKIAEQLNRQHNHGKEGYSEVEFIDLKKTFEDRMK